ncbi:MAG: outer membrane beta-barrel protein [Erythrobacter sp.]|uniref:outer membrane protein n=1 Tax=Erythrobacter sp. TaxID=1042 RepID=UPI0025E1E793|nr:outer membrane beta-barrel protein [Erythrobacter sp.]MCL9998749.1 outer membrane beta-barrel protein [Erythrobacter sp.]
MRISTGTWAMVALTSWPAVAAAQEQSQEPDQGWYVSASGSLSLLEDSVGTVANAIGPGGVAIPTLTTDNEVENGWGASAAFGRDFGRVRAEVEVGYSENDASSYSVSSPFVVTLPQDGRNDITRYMGNVYVDLTTGGIRPYVGAGLGAARVEVVTVATVAAAPTAPPRRLIDDDDTVFAYQLMAGVSVPVTRRLRLNAQYRWFDADLVRGLDARGQEFTRTIQGHNFDLGLRFTF